MSKTYKDQRRWDANNYWNKNFVGLGSLPEPKDINKPDNHGLYRFCCGNKTAKFWYNWSWRKLRRETKYKIYMKDYDNIIGKPENVDWNIC